MINVLLTSFWWPIDHDSSHSDSSITKCIDLWAKLLCIWFTHFKMTKDVGLDRVSMSLINSMWHRNTGCQNSPKFIFIAFTKCPRSFYNIKRVIDHKCPTCRSNNRLHAQPFWMPLEQLGINTLWCFKRASTDRQTDGQTLPNVLSPLLCGR